MDTMTKPDTTESLIDEVRHILGKPEGYGGDEYAPLLLTRLRSHCYRLGQHAVSAVTTDTREQQWLRELLARIHQDGGHHTEKVGVEQSAVDADRIVSGLLAALDEAYIQLAAARDEIAVTRANGFYGTGGCVPCTPQPCPCPQCTARKAVP